jgi:hypothetical protein
MLATPTFWYFGLSRKSIGTTNPDFDIGDGHNFGLVSRIIPDVTFDGSTVNSPSLDFTVRPRQFPGTNYGNSRFTNCDPAHKTIQVPTVHTTYSSLLSKCLFAYRGRQMAFRVESNDLGVAWQLGVPRIDTRPDGRR